MRFSGIKSVFPRVGINKKESLSLLLARSKAPWAICAGIWVFSLAFLFFFFPFPLVTPWRCNSRECAFANATPRSFRRGKLSSSRRSVLQQSFLTMPAVCNDEARDRERKERGARIQFPNSDGGLCGNLFLFLKNQLEYYSRVSWLYLSCSSRTETERHGGEVCANVSTRGYAKEISHAEASLPYLAECTVRRSRASRSRREKPCTRRASLWLLARLASALPMAFLFSASSRVHATCAHSHIMFLRVYV